MPNIDILIMAIIRGAAEVLPIDFAAHSLLVSWLICWPARGQFLSAAADGGILVALLLYFWRDVGQMLRALVRILRGKRDPGGRLILQILLGSLPAFAIVFVLREVLVGSDSRIGHDVALVLLDDRGGRQLLENPRR